MRLPRVTVCLLLCLLPLKTTAAEREVIDKKDQLPRHSYRVELPVTALYEPENRRALRTLAAAVAADV